MKALTKILARLVTVMWLKMKIGLMKYEDFQSVITLRQIICASSFQHPQMQRAPVSCHLRNYAVNTEVQLKQEDIKGMYCFQKEE